MVWLQITGLNIDTSDMIIYRSKVVDFALKLLQLMKRITQVTGDDCAAVSKNLSKARMFGSCQGSNA